MTDTQNNGLDMQSWQSRLMSSQNSNSNPAPVEAPADTPEQQLQREVQELLVTLRGTTAQILNLRDEAVKRDLARQSIGSRASTLLGVFTNPFAGDQQTTMARRQTEAEIRQSYIATESQRGGIILEKNPQPGKQTNWFGIDELGNAVWVRLEGGQAIVTTYYYGLELTDPVFKVQSIQDAGGAESPEKVDRLLLSVREFRNLTDAIAILHNQEKTLCGIPEKTSQTTPSSPLAPVPDIQSRSLPVDDSHLPLAA